MALPIAQLGYMPNINLPSRVDGPRDDPKIWEQALAQFLAGAAGSAGNQIVGNAMSRDYTDQATTAGMEGLEEKPGLIGRTFQGPQVSQGEFERFSSEQRQQKQFDASLAQRGTELDKLMERFSLELGVTKGQLAAQIAQAGRSQTLREAEFEFRKPLLLGDATRQDNLANHSITMGKAGNTRANEMHPLNLGQAATGIGQTVAATEGIQAETLLRGQQIESNNLLNDIRRQQAESAQTTEAPTSDPWWKKVAAEAGLFPLPQMEMFADKVVGPVAGHAARAYDRVTGNNPESRHADAQSFKPAADAVSAREAQNQVPTDPLEQILAPPAQAPSTDPQPSSQPSSQPSNPEHWDMWSASARNVAELVNPPRQQLDPIAQARMELNTAAGNARNLVRSGQDPVTTELIAFLTKHLGRTPSQQEVQEFIISAQ